MNLTKLSQNIYQIDDFLTPTQCTEFITQAESEGFKSADVDLGNSRQQFNLIRNNERVDWYDESLADKWWHRLDDFNGDMPVFEAQQAIGFSPYFRCYKYSKGQKFNMHKDGRQKVAGKQTRFTFLVYLNEGYEGGQTSFRQDNLCIEPKAGMALMFEHHLWHKGELLLEGHKYVLRTDVVFD